MKPKELIDFENVCGVKFSKEMLKSQRSGDVELRDMFVGINFNDKHKKEHDKFAKILNKKRSSIYASVKRFNDMYRIYSSYRSIVDTFKSKLKQ